MGDAGRCLTLSPSSHNSYSSALAKENPLFSLTLFLSQSPLALSLFIFLTLPLFPYLPESLAASREQHARGVRSKHRLLPQMLRGEWGAWMRECWAAARLPPLPPPCPPFPTHPPHRPVSCSAGGSEPAHCPLPTSLSEAVIGFLACPSALSLTSPSLGVNTFALWLALSPHRHTPASAWFGREKAL